MNDVISGIHSGWRGTKLNIVNKGIKIMNDKFNSKPKQLLVYISPCASGNNYEVEYDVAQYFPNSVSKINDKKYLYDNRSEIYNQLLDARIKKENIESSKICTIDNLNYHSFRRDGNKSGRMSAFIGLKK